MSFAAPRSSSPAVDLSERLRVLAEVVASLLERVDLLEEQRALLVRKIEMLERATRPELARASRPGATSRLGSPQ